MTSKGDHRQLANDELNKLSPQHRISMQVVPPVSRDSSVSVGGSTCAFVHCVLFEGAFISFGAYAATIRGRRLIETDNDNDNKSIPKRRPSKTIHYQCVEMWGEWCNLFLQTGRDRCSSIASSGQLLSLGSLKQL